MRKAYVIIAALLMQFIVAAQSKLKFSSIEQLGIAVGISQPGDQLQTINGFGCKHLFMGIGTV